MSEIEFLTVCAGCSIFTDIWASENQSLRAGEGIAAPQSRENLQTFVRSEAGLCPPPSTIQTSVKFRVFEELIFIM